jgi:hypothetical protein
MNQETVPGKLSKDEERDLVKEMQQMEYEPLLPVEKKLIAYSISLGVILLFFFIWLSQTYFKI